MLILLQHLYEVWCSQDHSELDDLLVQYFPFTELWEGNASELEGKYLSHWDLSKSERHELLQRAEVHSTLR